MTLDELKNKIDALILKAVTPDMDYEAIVRLEELAQIRIDLDQVGHNSTEKLGVGDVQVKINGLFAFIAEDVYYEADLVNGRSVSITTSSPDWMGEER